MTDPVLPLPPSDDPTEVQPSKLWLRDSRGYGSVTLTILMVSFFVTTLAYVLSIIEHIGKVSIRPFDVSACAGYFIPILTLYATRKFTEAKFNTGALPAAPSVLKG